jgi:hypothetical protein
LGYTRRGSGKRRRRAAGMAAGAKSREQRRSRQSGSSASKWWLTPASRKCCCAVCGTVLRESGDIVYRKCPGEVRCVPCAARLADSKSYRPSLRWESAKRKAG